MNPSSLSEQRARRVRAGSPPPSSDRAELRAAMKHGPYSYGAPPNSARMPLEDLAEESLQSRLKATEQGYQPAVRPVFIWALGLAICALAFSAVARSIPL